MRRSLQRPRFLKTPEVEEEAAEPVVVVLEGAQAEVQEAAPAGAPVAVQEEAVVG